MNYEQMQIALCEWAGIVIDKHTRLALPDCNSLDVLAGFEGKLDEEQRITHFRHVEAIVDRDERRVVAFAVGDATAKQRLEALLRTLGLWITDEARDQKPSTQAKGTE